MSSGPDYNNIVNQEKTGKRNRMQTLLNKDF
jgi:hypothetical protein